MIVVHRGGDRAVDRQSGITTWHSFSAGRHFDSGNVSFGPLVAHDEHQVGAGHGFSAHVHRGVDIVTWVIDGTLRHEHDGTRRELPAGSVQYLGAGTGVTHAEGASPADAVRFVQMWLLTDGRSPVRYAHARAAAGDLVPLASSRQQDGALRIAAVGCTLWLCRPRAGTTVQLPPAALVHVFVVRGPAAVDGELLDAGDAARITGAGALGVTDIGDQAEALVWQLDDSTE